VTFHSQDKLRTVIWQFAGDRIDPENMLLLEKAAKMDFATLFHDYLEPTEISAIHERINLLLASQRFPLPSDTWPPIPWPPV
jgi:hypothetical protein